MKTVKDVIKEEKKEYLIYMKINDSIKIFNTDEYFTMKNAVDTIDDIASKIFNILDNNNIKSESFVSTEYYSIVYQSNNINIKIELGIIKPINIKNTENALKDILNEKYLLPVIDYNLPF